jgi:hypothetical protein
MGLRKVSCEDGDGRNWLRISSSGRLDTSNIKPLVSATGVSIRYILFLVIFCSFKALRKEMYIIGACKLNAKENIWTK